MSLIFIAKLVLAGANVLFGVVALLRPDLIARIIGVQAEGAQGRAELRIQYGGMYVALGVGAILLQFYPTAFVMFGLAYAGMALTRLALMAREAALRTPLNIGLLALEVICAGVFIAESSWLVV
jgi:hypothetical protein